LKNKHTKRKEALTILFLGALPPAALGAVLLAALRSLLLLRLLSLLLSCRFCRRWTFFLAPAALLTLFAL